jgi:hypothetical protein
MLDEEISQSLLEHSSMDHILPVVSNSNRGHSNQISKLYRKRTKLCVLAAVISALCAVFAATNYIFRDTFDYDSFRGDGCIPKIIEYTRTMESTYKFAKRNYLIDPELGNPVSRRPRTAIINFVTFHTEVVAALAYHFYTLKHDVTVYVRPDHLNMNDVVEPWFTRGFKFFSRFFEDFYNYDVIVIATFPTCHIHTLQTLTSFDLPQKYIGLVHNPDALNSTDVAELVADTEMSLLTIAPHVSKYSTEVLRASNAKLLQMEEAEEVEKKQKHEKSSPKKNDHKIPDLYIDLDWIAPIFPVLYQDECQATSTDADRAALSYPWPRLPGYQIRDEEGNLENGTAVHRSCNKTHPDGWEMTENIPPPAVVNAKQGVRQGFCVQGKVDPSRRNYDALFSAIQDNKEELLKANFTLIIQGKGGGQYNAEVQVIPEDLLEAGLVRHFSSLPFPEYYDLLHSCEAILPLFASDAYFVNKGSSSVGASIITGTPLIATPKLLAAYHFFDESMVHLVDENATEVESMMAVLATPPELRRAKEHALMWMRRALYDRNLYVLQRQLGERFYVKRTAFKGTEKEVTASLMLDNDPAFGK